MSQTSFFDLGLLPEIQQALKDVEYETPTPIQEQAIPHLLDKRDVLGCAQTGTGKTAAFALPILHHLGKEHRKSIQYAPRALILSPTRELAAQIGESFETYGKHLKLRHTVVFGGVGQGRQVRAMQRGIHILIATPGRLLDLMNQGYVRLDNLEIFVLDEADRMLDMGFLPDLKRIISKLPKERQSLFFTATLPPGRVTELAEGLLKDPVRVEVTPQSSTVERIEQQVLFVNQSEKPELLANMVQSPDMSKVLVFTRTKRGADKVARLLNQNGTRADAIHGNKSQNARTRTLDLFRSDRLQVLVATDLAARGIDVEGVTHVINFELPYEPECYVHRIGRTGRAGASGIALTLCDSSERKLLREIEKLVRQQLPVHEEYPDRNPHSHSRGPSRGPGRGPGRGPSRGQPRGRGPGQRPQQRPGAPRQEGSAPQRSRKRKRPAKQFS